MGVREKCSTGNYIYCGVPGSPFLSKTGLILARIFHFDSLLVCMCLAIALRKSCDVLEGKRPVSRRGLEPRWFLGDPAPLALNNIYKENSLLGTFQAILRGFFFLVNLHQFDTEPVPKLYISVANQMHDKSWYWRKRLQSDAHFLPKICN